MCSEVAPVKEFDSPSMGNCVPAFLLELLLNFRKGGYCGNLNLPTPGLQKRRTKDPPLRARNDLLILTEQEVGEVEDAEL